MSASGEPTGPRVVAVRAPEIRMRGISKRYGPTVANDNVDLELDPGEIHVLLGENGAGKTTLMEILYGFLLMDRGEIEVAGQVVPITSPHTALELGIGMVHQHFMLVSSFTVAENVVLGAGSPANMKYPRRKLEEEVQEAADRYGLDLRAEQRSGDLGSDGQQRIEILRLLYRGARVLVLDEPTASLGPKQIESLFATLRSLAAGGHAILMVTHKFSEVLHIADRVTVLKQGRRVLSAVRGELDGRTLALAMTGEEMPKPPPKVAARSGAKRVLEVEGLEVAGSGDADALRGVSFHVDGGEILGIAGVAGNGQLEIEEALGGVRRIKGGRVLVAGEEVTGAQPRDLHRAGVGVIPSDRRSWGVVLDMSLAENLGLAAVPQGRFTHRGILSWRALRAHAQELLEAFDVRPADPDAPAHALSGGNQQKMVLARELARRPRVLIAANPTQGLDIRAMNYVHRRLVDARAAGGAIVLISQDLEELLTLCDRVIVLYRGSVVYESPTESISMNALAMAMGGGSAQDRDAA
jgi:general nucleoside transport system ATP-binding protein